MNANQKDVGRGFWLAWTIASIIGFIVGAVLGHAAFHIAGDVADVKGMTAIGSFLGLSGGFAQWLVLRRQIARTGWWTLVSPLGFVLAAGTSVLVDAIFTNVGPITNGIVFALTYGVAGGILQWLVLHRHLPRANYWVVANLLGSLLGYGAAIPVIAALTQQHPLELIAFGAVFGAGLGSITGAALVWLLQQSESGSSIRTAAEGVR